MAVGQELPAHGLVRGQPHLLGPLGEEQQVAHGLGPGDAVGRVNQDAVDAVVDLVTDAADCGGHHWGLLPHRLSHRQTEGLDEGALGDHRADPLDGVDNSGVDLPVLHAHRGHVDP